MASKHLNHFGVKGMKWGFRRKRDSTEVISKDYSESRALMKKPIKTLSNDDIQKVNRRLNLEGELKRLNPTSFVQRHLELFLSKYGKQVITAAAGGAAALTIAAVKKQLGHGDENMDYVTDDNTIVHFGVKGMKWGVRRYRSAYNSARRINNKMSDPNSRAGARFAKIMANPESREAKRMAKRFAKADKEWEIRSESLKKSVAVSNSTCKRMNNGLLAAFNEKYKGKNLYEDETARKAYSEEYRALFSKVINQEADKFFDFSPSGSKRVNVAVDDDLGLTFSFEELEHSMPFDLKVKVVRDSKGFITRLELFSSSEEEV